MTTKYNTPTVEAIQEDSEEESMEESMGKNDGTHTATYYRESRTSGYTVMAPVKANTGRERERRRSHRSNGGGGGGRRRTKERDTKHDRTESDRPRVRHRRSLSNRSTGSTSSSDDEEQPIQDHRVVLSQARERLTSPSMISTITSLTTSTNKSSGSSGSNSTVTQASITKRSLSKRPEIPEAPMSPAVPDAPNVFAFLDNDSTTTLGINEEEQDQDGNQGVEDDETRTDEDDDDDETRTDEDDDDENREDEDDEEDQDEDEVEEESQWQSHEYETSELPHLTPDQSSASSSASSSIHGSDSLEPAVDNDTDRSTSPERSLKDHASENEVTADPASAKLASQMAAAQQRQSLYASGTVQSFGTPNMARGPTVYPYVPTSTALSPRHAQPVNQRNLPRGEKLPVTGYELLATRLSHSNVESEEAKIKPMYRKFEALNHRLLLHLQDEIGELEERLHRLDHADTQSRTAGNTGAVVPASRRASQAAGGELQWHKTDILGRIGFKLAQYNQALAAFNTTQGLNPPDPEDISTYRDYLSSEHPIVEAETHFLDPTDDLVSVCSERLPRRQTTFCPETQTSYASSVEFLNTPHTQPAPPGLSGLAVAIAVAVLIPILTFSVIPGFIGRMTVAGLVAGGVVFALMQSGEIGRGMVGREGLICGGVYGGVMLIIASIMA